MKYYLISLCMSRGEVEYLKKLSEDNFIYYNFNEMEKLEDFLLTIHTHVVIAINLEPEHSGDLEQGSDLTILNLSSRLANREHTHTILLPTNASTSDRVFGSSFSVASYIIKPFNLLELVYTAENLITKSSKHLNVISDENFYINLVTREVLYKDKKLNVGPKLFDMIVYFVNNPGKVISRSEFLEQIFDITDYLDDRSIDANIKKIRKKTDYTLIQTVRGKGYRYYNGA